LITTPSGLEHSFVARPLLPSTLYIVAMLSLFVLVAVPAPVEAVEPTTSSVVGGMAATLLIIVLGAVALGALIIVGLVLWSHKQEHIHDMMLFCMKYLVHSKDEAERCHSAKALRRVRDPGALLVLVDVIWDEEEPEVVREAASEALHEMSVNFRKYGKVITELEVAAEKRDLHRMIEILTTNFEQGEKRYVQSAYIIGRHYMRLERYLDAREWLTTAEFRNRKFNLYGNRIRHWIQVCNTRLLEEADDSFMTANFQQARERYAALDHGLSDADRQHYAVYLRSACVYCKLNDYRDADLALLQALEHNHETDLALTLVPLLREILSSGDNEVEGGNKLKKIKSDIDERSSLIMSALSEKAFEKAAEQAKEFG